MSKQIIYKLQKIIPSAYWNVFKQNNAMVAGGCLLSITKETPISDIDVYFKSRHDCYNFINDMISLKFVTVAVTKRSCVLRGKFIDYPINVIFFDTFEKLEDVFTAFDFGVCMVGYDFQLNQLVTGKSFWQNIAENKLIYSTSRYPIGALLRIQKYIKKGYTIDTESYLKILRDIGPIVDMPVEKIVDQLSGMYGLKLDITKLKSLDDIITAFETQVIEPKCGFPVDSDVYEEIFKDLFKQYKIITDKGVFGLTMCGARVYSRGHLICDKEELDSASEMEFPLTLWKYVKLDGSSIYRNNYYYHVGEYVVDNNYGLYCDFKGPSLETHKQTQGCQLVELIINNPSDIMRVEAGAIVVRKAFVKSMTKITGDTLECSTLI